MVTPKNLVKNLLRAVTKFYEMGKCPRLGNKMILRQVNVDKSNRKLTIQLFLEFFAGISPIRKISFGQSMQ